MHTWIFNWETTHEMPPCNVKRDYLNQGRYYGGPCYKHMGLREQQSKKSH